MEIVYTTISSLKEASYLARALLESKLAACAMVIPGAVSFYYWDEELKQEQEFMMVIKTTTQAVKMVIQKIEMLHSYKCPAIWSIIPRHVNEKFLKWISNNTNGV